MLSEQSSDCPGDLRPRDGFRARKVRVFALQLAPRLAPGISWRDDAHEDVDGRRWRCPGSHRELLGALGEGSRGLDPERPVDADRRASMGPAPGRFLG